MQSHQPITITYDTREESNQHLGIGLGCNGVIDVLIEPVIPGHPRNPIDKLATVLQTQEPLALATTFIGPYIGQRMLLKGNQEVYNDVEDPGLADLIRLDLHHQFTQRYSCTRGYANDTTEVFLELIQPNITVMIFGGGFDARPVSQLANMLGWEVSVTDECVAHLAPVFFPDANKLSLCHRDYIDRDFTITPYTACVLMSHNYEYDRDVLKKLLPTATPYIGILGPRKRFDKMLQEFFAQNIQLSVSDLERRVHAPIGLDIGAETPDEIALAIVAEIQSRFTNRTGGFLKYRNLPIHQRDLHQDQVFKRLYVHAETPQASSQA